MGRAANLSPLGLYKWDDSLFDLMQIPSALDRNTLIDNLLAETAELEVLYPNHVVLKNLIGVWSAKQIEVWKKLYETTQYDYNPIENYNRYETGSNTGTATTTQSGTDKTTDRTTIDGTDKRTIDRDMGGHDTTSGSSKSGHWIAGYDAGTPTAQDDGLFKQSRDEGTTSSTITYGGTEDVVDTLRKNETMSKDGSVIHGAKTDRADNGSHNLHAHGNIGVTTTQKLIQEQREIDLFNLYDIIIEDFKMRFCILVY